MRVFRKKSKEVGRHIDKRDSTTQYSATLASPLSRQEPLMILLIVSGRTIAILLTCTLITLILVGLFKFRDDLANSHPHRAPVGLGATM